MPAPGSGVAPAAILRRSVPFLVSGVVAGACLLAVIAKLTGSAGLLHHDIHIHASLPLWAAVGLFVLAWQAMIAAMTVPSSVPLIRLYQAAIAQQPGRGRLLAAFLAGYAAVVWIGFGMLAFLGDVAAPPNAQVRDQSTAQWLPRSARRPVEPTVAFHPSVPVIRFVRQACHIRPAAGVVTRDPPAGRCRLQQCRRYK
jgi:hypothetical protein